MGGKLYISTCQVITSWPLAGTLSRGISLLSICGGTGCSEVPPHGDTAWSGYMIPEETAGRRGGRTGMQPLGPWAVHHWRAETIAVLSTKLSTSQQDGRHSTGPKDYILSPCFHLLWPNVTLNYAKSFVRKIEKPSTYSHLKYKKSWQIM